MSKTSLTTASNMDSTTLDFYFFSFGIVTDGKCVAIRDLPDYDIESISTGQIIIENGPTYRHIWKSEFHLDE